MRLELYITDLLFRHDCVIVPNLGAFISRSLPAEVAPSTNMFRPARKQLAFNASLKQSDGLLYGYASRVNDWSFERARTEVDNSISNWKQELAQGSKIRLEYIGQLYTASQGQLQFMPALESNFDLSSYGMGIFHIPSLDLKTKTSSTTNSGKTEEASQEVLPFIAIQQGRSWSQWKWAAVLVPLFALSGLAWMQRGELKEAVSSYSNIGPVILGNEAEKVITAEDFQGVQGLKTKSVIPFSSDSSSPTDHTSSLSEESVAKHVTTKEAVATIEIKKEVEAPVAPKATSNSNYYIIVGSFKEEANTRKMIGRLKSLGYSAQVAPGKGLNRVAAASFSTQLEAQQQLQTIKQNIESRAWIYRP
jgi:cell division septation protein DedD